MGIREMLEEDEVSRRRVLQGGAAGIAAALAGCHQDEADDRDVDDGGTPNDGQPSDGSDPGSGNVEVYDETEFSSHDLDSLIDDIENWEDDIGGYDSNSRTETPSGVIDEREEYAELVERVNDKQEEDRWFTLTAGNYRGTGQLVTPQILLRYTGDDSTDSQQVNPRNQLGRGPDRSFSFIKPDEIRRPGTGFSEIASNFMEDNNLPTQRLENTVVQNFLGTLASVEPYFRDNPDSSSGLDVEEGFVDSARDEIGDLIDDIHDLEQDHRELLDEVEEYRDENIEEIDEWLEGLTDNYDRDTVPESGYQNNDSLVEVSDVAQYVDRLEDVKGQMNAFYEDVLEDTAKLTITRKVFEHAYEELEEIEAYETDEVDEPDNDDPDNGDDDDNGEDNGEDDGEETPEEEIVERGFDVRNQGLYGMYDDFSSNQLENLLGGFLDEHDWGGYGEPDMDELFNEEYSDFELAVIEASYEAPEDRGVMYMEDGTGEVYFKLHEPGDPDEGTDGVIRSYPNEEQDISDGLMQDLAEYSE